jgi:antitoxin CptB
MTHIGQLKWRCRRGLLENDLLIERFFARHEQRLTPSLVMGLEALLDLTDNDLLDLLLARKEPDGALDRSEVREVLALMRPGPNQPSQANAMAPPTK